MESVLKRSSDLDCYVSTSTELQKEILALCLMIMSNVYFNRIFEFLFCFQKY